MRFHLFFLCFGACEEDRDKRVAGRGDGGGGGGGEVAG